MQVGESSAHWSKRTLAMPLPASLAVAETVAGSAVARLTGFGATTESGRIGVVDRDA